MKCSKKLKIIHASLFLFSTNFPLIYSKISFVTEIFWSWKICQNFTSIMSIGWQQRWLIHNSLTLISKDELTRFLIKIWGFLKRNSPEKNQDINNTFSKEVKSKILGANKAPKKSKDMKKYGKLYSLIYLLHKQIEKNCRKSIH